MHDKHFADLVKASSLKRIKQVFDIDLSKIPEAPKTNFLEYYAF